MHQIRFLAVAPTSKGREVMKDGMKGQGKREKGGEGPTSKARGEEREEREGLAPKPKYQTSSMRIVDRRASIFHQSWS